MTEEAPEFQDTILGLSEAIKDGEAIEFTAGEAVALFDGFITMSNTIQQSVEIIERLEAEKEKKRLWRP